MSLRSERSQMSIKERAGEAAKRITAITLVTLGAAGLASCTSEAQGPSTEELTEAVDVSPTPTAEAADIPETYDPLIDHNYPRVTPENRDEIFESLAIPLDATPEEIASKFSENVSIWCMAGADDVLIEESLYTYNFDTQENPLYGDVAEGNREVFAEALFGEGPHSPAIEGDIDRLVDVNLNNLDRYDFTKGNSYSGASETFYSYDEVLSIVDSEILEDGSIKVVYLMQDHNNAAEGGDIIDGYSKWDGKVYESTLILEPQDDRLVVTEWSNVEQTQ